MCNRYDPGPRQLILDVIPASGVGAPYNANPDRVHPKELGPVVRLVDGEMMLERMTWGFPVTLRGRKGQPLAPKPVNNARFDKLDGFWKRWAVDPHNRCLIPAARFAEAIGPKGKMTEAWLSVRDQPIFAWAGLWSNEAWGQSYTGVMTDNCIEFADIHDRSPVILDPEHWRTWLTAPLADLYQFDRPYPAERMVVERTDIPWVKRKEPEAASLL